MKKRVLSMLLAVVFVLAGCGSSAESGKGKQSRAVNEREVTIVPEKEMVVTGEVSRESEEAAGEKETAETGTPEESKTPAETKESSAVLESAGKEAKEVSDAAKKQDTSKKADASKEPGTASKDSQANGNQANSGKVNGDKAETEKTPTEQTPHTCTFDGGKVTAAASCNSTGTKTFTCTKCGATKTESIPKTSHNYVEETKGATCTEAGYTKTYCSNCGDVKSQTSSGNPAGHNYQKSYWPSAPTCSSGGSYNLICTACGANGGHGSDSALPHTPVTREENHGSCTEQTIIVTECSVCGAYMGREAYFEEHSWVSGTAINEYFDPETNTVVREEVPVNKCSVCGFY